MQAIAKTGDTIVFARPDRRYDVLRMNVRGAREVVCVGLTDIHHAYIIARAHHALSGEVWISDHADPDAFEPYQWECADAAKT